MNRIILVCYFLLFLTSSLSLAGGSKRYYGKYRWDGENRASGYFYIELEDSSLDEGAFSFYFYEEAENQRLRKADGVYTISNDEIELKSGDVAYEGKMAPGRKSIEGTMNAEYYTGTWSASYMPGSMKDMPGSKESTLYVNSGMFDMPSIGLGVLIQDGGAPYMRTKGNLLMKSGELGFDIEIGSYAITKRHDKDYYSMNLLPVLPAMLFALAGGGESNLFSYLGAAIIGVPVLLNTSIVHFPVGQRFFSMNAGLDYDWFHINPLNELNRFGAHAGLSFYIGNFILSGDYHHFFTRRIMQYEGYTDSAIGISLSYMFVNL